MKHPQLANLLSNRPSILRNGTLVFIVRMTAWLWATALFIIGISLLLDAFMDYNAIARFIVLDDYLNQQIDLARIKRVKVILGLLAILLSILCYSSVVLARMVRKRNLYLSELLLWCDNFLNAETKQELEDEQSTP